MGAATRRPIQLRRWLRELGGGMVCGQEGVVLQGTWKGLPRSGSWMRPCGTRRCSVRLQRRLCQLDGRMECAKEGLVLQECWQGLPASSWRLCLSALLERAIAGELDLERWCSHHLPALSKARSPRARSGGGKGVPLPERAIAGDLTLHCSAGVRTIFRRSARQGHLVHDLEVQLHKNG